MSYARDAIHEWSSGFVSLGFPERAVGHSELFRAMTEWAAVWERWTMTPCFVVDMGNTLLSFNRLAGRSASSGLDVEMKQVGVLDLAQGLIVRERDFNDWSDGLRAAGIDLEVLPQLEGLAPGQTIELVGVTVGSQSAGFRLSSRGRPGDEGCGLWGECRRGDSGRQG